MYARVIFVSEHIHVTQCTSFFKQLQESVWSYNDLPVQKRLKGKIISNPSEIHHSQETHLIDKDQTGNEETKIFFHAALFPSGQPHYNSPSLCHPFSHCLTGRLTAYLWKGLIFAMSVSFYLH